MSVSNKDDVNGTKGLPQGTAIGTLQLYLDSGLKKLADAFDPNEDGTQYKKTTNTETKIATVYLKAIPAAGYQFAGLYKINASGDEGSADINEGIEWWASDPVYRVYFERLPLIANAGADQTVYSGDTVTLNGSGSSDPVGGTLSYKWSYQAPSFGPVISNDTQVIATFTAPDVTQERTLTLNLRVNVGTYSANDQVVITVKPNETPTNNSPTAVAGADAGVATPVTAGTLVTLIGSGSTDPDGDALTYNWERISGPEVEISNPTAMNPTFTAPESACTLVFRLTVNDQKGGTDTAEVTITVIVNEPPTNNNPTAVAGADAGVATPVTTGTLVTLVGSGSTDPDGDALTYNWEWISGPEVEISNPTAMNPTFTAPESACTLVFRLTVDDQKGGTGTAQVTITVIVGEPETRETFLLYYPHVDSGHQGTWETIIHVMNESDEDLEGTLRGYNDEGQEVSTVTGVLVPPMGMKQYVVGEAFTQPASIRYIVFESYQEGAIGFEKIFLTGVSMTSMQAYKRSVLPEGAESAVAEANSNENGGPADGFLLDIEQQGWNGAAFVNTEDAGGTIDLKAYNADGVMIIDKNMEIAAHGHLGLHLLTVFAGVNDFSEISHIRFTSERDVIGIIFNASPDQTSLSSMPAL